MRFLSLPHPNNITDRQTDREVTHVVASVSSIMAAVTDTEITKKDKRHFVC
jgi:hypothetical protein